MSGSNPLKKLAGQTAIYGLSSILGRFLNYLLVFLHTDKDIFDTAQYGVITEMYAYVAFLIILLTYGMETAFFRFSTQDKWKGFNVFGQTFSALSVTSGLFILTCFLFDQQIADALGYHDYPQYVRWFGMIVALDALATIPLAKLRKESKALKFALVNLANVAIFIGLNLFLLMVVLPDLQTQGSASIYASIFDPDIGVGLVFIANLAASAVKFLLLAPEMKFKWFTFNKALLKPMLIYASPLLIYGLAGQVNETLDRILLKHLLWDELGEVETMRQLGIYGACYKISILITLFIQAFRYAADPFFFAQEKDKNSPKTYAKVLNYFMIVCAVIFAGIMLYMDIIKHMIRNEEMWEGLSVVPILLLANICLGIYFNLSIWYKLSGKTYFGAYISIFGALITIVANLWWIPKYGYMGSAWATLASYGSMTVLSYFLGQKHFPIPYQKFKVLGYIVGALGVYALSHLWNDGGTSMKLILNTLLFLTFVAALLFTEYKTRQTLA